MSRISDLRGKATTGLFWSFSDLIARQGIQFVVHIVLARLLLPSDFGIIGMVTVFIAISNTFIDSGFSQALIRDQKVNQRDCSTVFYFNLLVACIIYVVLFFSAPAISRFFREPQLVTILRVLSLVLIINSFGLIQRTMLVKQIDFRTQTRIGIIASVLSGGAAILLAYLGFGVWSLVIRTLILQLTVSLLLMISNRWIPSMEFSFRSFKRLFSFGSRLLFSSLIGTVYKSIYNVIIGRFFLVSDLGFYTNARRLEEVASHAVATSLQRVSYPVLSSIQEDESLLQHGFRKIIKASTFVNFPIMIILAAIAESLIPGLLGERWIPSVPYFQLLCFAGMLYPLHAINLNILKVRGRSDLDLRAGIINKIAPTVLIVLVLSLGLGIMGLLWSVVISSYISFLINTIYSKKVISYSSYQQIRDVFPAFAIALLTGAVVYLAGNALPFGNVLTSVSQVALGACLYIGLARLLKIKELSVIKDLILGGARRMKRREL